MVRWIVYWKWCKRKRSWPSLTGRIDISFAIDGLGAEIWNRTPPPPCTQTSSGTNLTTIRFCRCSVPIPAGAPAVLTEVSRGFPQAILSFGVVLLSDWKPRHVPNLGAGVSTGTLIVTQLHFTFPLRDVQHASRCNSASLSAWPSDWIKALRHVAP
jgi:hypothetical protein